MKVALLGHKTVSKADITIIATTLVRLLQDGEVEELIIPGIDGACANALALAITLRTDLQRPGVRIRAVFPGKWGERPPWHACAPSPEGWACSADETVGLELPMGPGRWPYSILRCYEHVVDQVADCGQAMVFWNGDKRADTGVLVEYLQKKNIPWEHINISGEEDP